MTFQRDLCWRNLGSMISHEWWANFGGSTPELQAYAIKVLSQACSISGAEQCWGQHDTVHSKKRNRLTKTRVDKLVFVGSNLRRRQAVNDGKQCGRHPHVDSSGSESDGGGQPMLNNGRPLSRVIGQ